MAVPPRPGISTDEFDRLLRSHDQARDRVLQRTQERTDLGGAVVIWYRTDHDVAPEPRAIQPGIADDLPSLLSALAAEIAWPGVNQDAVPSTSPSTAQRAIAVWARVWQIREMADLRVVLYWDAQGAFHGKVSYYTPEGLERPLPQAVDLEKALNRLAAKPQVSESPHGLLLAGNQAMAAGDYDSAVACYARALPDLPQHVEAHRNMALALARQDNWMAAADIMQQAWLLAPKDATLSEEYIAVETDAGVKAAQEGDLGRAGEHFLRILNYWPNDPTALANLGNIRLREGREREARAIFRRFLRLHPQHAAAKEIQLALEQLGTE